jgi:hypothetical protein
MANGKIKSLGRLAPVELREYWEDEARDFTPWLANEDNLKLLSEAIGIELELVGRERPVGSFKVDILAKDTDSDKFVVIENQLEKTNHNHLGQLLTYASGYDAVAVIWVAKSICEEHRRALDWLNEMTHDGVSFFGLEMELWQIGESDPAPKFNLVSQPNDWARNVKPGSSGEREYTDTKLLQKEFWLGFIEHMKAQKTFLSLRKANPRHWYTIAVGRSHFHLSLTLNSRLKRVGVELYIKPPESKPAFSQLLEDKDAIEKELGATLDWQELPHRGASRIIQYHDGNFENKTSWNELFQWFQERAESFHKVFSQRVMSLDLEEDSEAA